MRRLLVISFGLVMVLLVVGGALAQADPHEQLVRSFYTAWNAEDADGAAALLSPDVVWKDPKVRGTIFVGTSRGRDLVRTQVLDAVGDNWQGFTVALDSVIRNGNMVFVSGSVSAFGRSSGRMLLEPYGAVWTVRDGVATRVTTFFNPDRWLVRR